MKNLWSILFVAAVLTVGMEAPSAAARRDRFKDCGAGTVEDSRTGLLWEKKNASDGQVDFENPHDVDNEYTWSSSAEKEKQKQDGTASTDFLKRLNTKSEETGTCFAGHCDWRLPTRGELLAIRQTRTAPPFVHPVFEPNAVAKYWSTTTVRENGNIHMAWAVKFFAGGRGRAQKQFPMYVRAVRVGSCDERAETSGFAGPRTVGGDVPGGPGPTP